MVVQADVTGGGPLAVVVTFLVAWVFYAVTLHLAALWVLGDVPHQRAALAAAVPALVSLLLQRYAYLAVAVTFLGDLVAVSLVYRLRLRSALLVATFHFVIAVLLGVALLNLLGPL